MSTCRNTTAKGERMLWEKQNFSVKNLLFLFALMLCYLLAFWSPCVLQLYIFFSVKEQMDMKTSKQILKTIFHLFSLFLFPEIFG